MNPTNRKFLNQTREQFPRSAMTAENDIWILPSEIFYVKISHVGSDREDSGALGQVSVVDALIGIIVGIRDADDSSLLRDWLGGGVGFARGCFSIPIVVG
jgi:hypothetical protein